MSDGRGSEPRLPAGLFVGAECRGQFRRLAIHAEVSEGPGRLGHDVGLGRGEGLDELGAVGRVGMFGQRQDQRIADPGVFPLRAQQRPRFVGRQLADQGDQFRSGFLVITDRGEPQFARGFRAGLPFQVLREQRVGRPAKLPPVDERRGQRRIAPAKLLEHFAHAERPVAAGKLPQRVELFVQAEQALGRGRRHHAMTLAFEQREDDQVMNVILDGRFRSPMRTLIQKHRSRHVGVKHSQQPPVLTVRLGITARKDRGHSRREFLARWLA